MPRKAPPTVTIGGPGAKAPAAPSRPARDDDRALERMGNRRAGDEHTDVQTVKYHGTKARPRFRERDQVEIVMTTVHVPRDLLRRARGLCVDTDSTFSALVERLLEAELAAGTRRAG